MKVSEKGMLFFASIMNLSRVVADNGKYLVKVKNKWVKLRFKDNSKVPVGSVPMLSMSKIVSLLKANGFEEVKYMVSFDSIDGEAFHQIEVKHQMSDCLVATGSDTDEMFDEASQKSEIFLLMIEDSKTREEQYRKSKEKCDDCQCCKKVELKKMVPASYEGAEFILKREREF